MDLPDELSPAEVELNQIYAEFKELKAEVQRRKDAEKLARKNRGADVVAEDAAEVVKKLKSSGLLEKLKIDDAPKTQFKRASNLERRLHTKPEPKTPTESSPANVPRGPRVTPALPTAQPAQIRRNFSSQDRPSFSAQGESSNKPAKPKNIFATYLNSNTAADTPALESSPSNSDSRRPAPTPSYSYNSSTRRPSDTSPSGAPASGYQANGYRQKMVLVEGDTVEETFVRPIFEKFGPLLRITSVPEKKQAFILFKIWEHSQNAIRDMHGKTVDGVLLNVTVGDSQNEPKNRALPTPTVRVPPPQAVQETRSLMTYEEGEMD